MTDATRSGGSMALHSNSLGLKMEIRRLIREGRKAKGLKQEALAIQVGLRRGSSVTQLERGQLIPSLDLSRKLEDALDLPPHAIGSLVVKLRVQEATAMLISEAEARGMRLQVHLAFKNQRAE